VATVQKREEFSQKGPLAKRLVSVYSFVDRRPLELAGQRGLVSVFRTPKRNPQW